MSRTSQPTTPEKPSRYRLLGAGSRVGGPVRVLISVAVIALGVVLILARLSVHGISIVTGTGLALIGIALLVFEGIEKHAARPSSRAIAPRIIGVLMILLGTVMALWPDAGAPWLAFLVGAALVGHGLTTGITALRGDKDRRTTGIITGLATIVIGALTFSWPVLTLTIFRLGVGAWFVFLGLQLIASLVVKHKLSSSPRAPRLRRWLRSTAAVTSLVVALGLAAGSAWVLGGSPLPEPGKFYVAPADVPNERGRLIKAEPLDTGVPAGAEAWRILYTTTHPDGSPAISSGTVVAPKKRGADPLPLLTVSHGTTGVVPKCAPSMSATPFSDGAAAALQTMVQDHGWAAVTSDYIGLGTEGPHPYLVGDAEARNVLDASLAAQELDGLTLDTRTVVWGHSQGGQGSLWTGQIAEKYAPELTVEGIAAFAPASDLYGLAEADKNNAAGKTVSAYIAATWEDIYPELKLSRSLTPGSARGVEKIEGLCFNGKDVISALLRGTQVPNQVFPDSLLDGAFGDKLKAQAPTGPFPAPVLVAQGLADPLVKPRLQKVWVDSRCKAGIEIDFRTFPGLNHTSLVADDSPLTPQIVQWTLDRWNGVMPTPNCGSDPEQ